ncbi:hypothetical protein KR222_005699 [Zaprionus bogoriensis]|nr:hypothetical protein KR222_005699 [Zaprionus bogoriensis]
MWKFLLFCVVMSAFSSEGDASSNRPQSRRRRGYAGSYAGGYASSNGGTGGYTGNYNDYDDYGDGGHYVPTYGIQDPYLFHQQLTNHILAQNYANQRAVTGLATSGNAFASADATISNDDTRIQQQIAAQQAYHDNLVRQNSYASSGSSGSAGGSSYNSHRYAPNYAAAAGSIGPNGYRQTAYISPANPVGHQPYRYIYINDTDAYFFSQATPNIVNRFGSSSSSSSSGGGGGGSGGGYKGVSVSSFSSSNGDGTSRRGAQTTINDNGKVTSYSVHS